MTADSESVPLYPVALDLRLRRCVVVGGGAVAVRKAEALIAAGAKVVVVAPSASVKMRELIAANRVVYLEEAFMPDHLDHATLAVAATDRPDVNGDVAAAALERNVLVNMAAGATDDNGADAFRDGSDFVTMAAVRRGDLVVAITTGGAGPALSARLKREIEAQFGPEWEPYVALLREMRAEAKNRHSDSAARTAALRRLAADDTIRDLIASGDMAGARREALACLS